MNEQDRAAFLKKYNEVVEILPHIKETIGYLRTYQRTERTAIAPNDVVNAMETLQVAVSELEKEVSELFWDGRSQ